MRTLKMIAALAAVCIILPVSICLADQTPIGERPWGYNWDVFTVSGRVYEDATGRPLSGIAVYSSSGGSTPRKMAETNKAGHYSFDVLREEHPGSPIAVSARIVYVTEPGHQIKIVDAGTWLPFPPEHNGYYTQDLYLDIPQEYATFSMILFEPGYDYEIVGEVDHDFPNAMNTITDNEGNIYFHGTSAATGFEDERGPLILKIDAATGETSEFATRNTRMVDLTHINRMAFDSVNGVMYVIAHHNGTVPKYLIKITGFTPLRDYIEAVPGPQGPQGETGAPGPQGEPGITPEEVAGLRAQIEGLRHEQNQRYRNLIYRIQWVLRWLIRRMFYRY